VAASAFSSCGFRTESRFSNYKKFDVESTITVDEPK